MKRYSHLIACFFVGFLLMLISCGESEKIDATDVEPISKKTEPLPKGEGNAMPDKSLFKKADQAAEGE